MTDRTPGTMGPEWIEREIRRANPEEVVAKIRHYEGRNGYEYTAQDGNTTYHVRANTRPPLPDATPLFQLSDEKPGMFATPRDLLTALALWCLLAGLAVGVIGAVVAFAWRMF